MKPDKTEWWLIGLTIFIVGMLALEYFGAFERLGDLLP